MKTKQYFSILLLIVLSTSLIFLTTCNKDSGDEDDNQINTDTLTLNAYKKNVYQTEIVILLSEGFDFNEDMYIGSIGGESVEIFVAGNNLGFIMPEITLGLHTLDVDIEGNNYQIEFNIIESQIINDPDSFIENSITLFTKSEDELNNLASLMDGMYGFENFEENINILILYLDDFQIQLDNASSEDKQILANFIAVNPEIFEELEDLIQYIGNDTSKLEKEYIPELTFEEMRSQFKIKVIKLGILVTAAVALNLAAPNPYVFLATSLAIVYKVYQLNNFLIIYADKNVYQVGNMILSEFKTDISFTNHVEYTLEVTSNYRNLFQEDITSTFPAVYEIVNSLDTFEEYWNEIMDLLPDALTGDPFHIKYVTNVNQQIFIVSPENVSISDISNLKISFESEIIAGDIYVTFSTEETTDQEFTFNLVYNNVNVSTSTTTISALLTLPDNTPPTASFVVTPLIGTIDTVFKFDASGTTDYEDPISLLQFRWDWEGDGIWDTDWLSWPDQTHVYSQPGSYSASLDVMDTGELTDTVNNTVEVLESNNLIPYVTTNSVFNISFSSASCIGEVIDEGGSPLIIRGVCWSTSSNPTIENQYLAYGNEPGLFQIDFDGLEPETNYYLKAFATNYEGTGYGEEKTFTTAAEPEPCPGLESFYHGGQVYHTVQIGGQCWMRENLNYTTANSWCYDNIQQNCDTYGRLYQWSSALNACPSEWHLPSDDEWCTLAQYLDSSVDCIGTGPTGTDAGTKLKSQSWGGSNISGFTGLPSGVRNFNGEFYSLGVGTSFWSSTEYAYPLFSYSWEFGIYSPTIYRFSGSAGHARSVRCVKD